jgi:CheY-like chemotaxis protein
MKILLIDDEDDIRRIARLSLSRLGGMEVVDAACGPDGVATARRERPDAILLDVMMPDVPPASRSSSSPPRRCPPSSSGCAGWAPPASSPSLSTR